MPVENQGNDVMQSRTERQQHAAAQRQKRARIGLAGLTATVAVAVAAAALGVANATGDAATDGAQPCVKAALGATALDTPTLRSLLTDPAAWAERGHPEWGTFTIDSPDPATTALGAAAFTGPAGVANGGPVVEALDYAAPSDGDFAVIKLEHAMRTESRREPTLPRPATVADSSAIASAFVTTEADLARYAASNPAVLMTGFPVAGGAAVVDWALSAPATASPQLRSRAPGAGRPWGLQACAPPAAPSPPPPRPVSPRRPLRRQPAR